MYIFSIQNNIFEEKLHYSCFFVVIILEVFTFLMTVYNIYCTYYFIIYIVKMNILSECLDTYKSDSGNNFMNY